jgi:hypothetical protein
MKSKSGLADSPFFTDSHVPMPVSALPLVVDSKAGINVGTEPASHQGGMIPRHHATTVERIRKAVRELGKEVSTHRFTLTEKRSIAQIVHTLHMQGIHTTENEVTRIAVNFLIQEYQSNEPESVLSLVIQALQR